MLDGVIITDATFKILFSRKTPTMISSLSSSYLQKQELEESSGTLLNSFAKIGGSPSSSPRGSRRASLSTTLLLAQKSGGNNEGFSNSLFNTDYKNQNIAWADTIVDYVHRVNKGSIPQPDGYFKVFSFMNERMIVFTRIENVLFFVVGDEDHGELALREVCKSVMEGCKSVCKRTPDDPELIIKNFGKVCTLIDDILQEDGLGMGLYNAEIEMKRLGEITD
ncbi:hypothetical protein ABK040_010843 [Willaertia magna]